MELPIVETSHSWFRSHPAEFGYIHYGRARRFRFDDPDGEYGVLYIAEDPFGAFVETFGQLMSTPAKLPRAISSGELSSKAVSEIVCSRTLRLADLTGPGLPRIGADARLFAGGDYSCSRTWSRALRDHPARVDGLLYRTRHDPERRAAPVFRETLEWIDLSRSTWLSRGRQLSEILQHCGFALIDSHLVRGRARKVRLRFNRPSASTPEPRHRGSRGAAARSISSTQAPCGSPLSRIAAASASKSYSTRRIAGVPSSIRTYDARRSPL